MRYFVSYVAKNKENETVFDRDIIDLDTIIEEEIDLKSIEEFIEKIEVINNVKILNFKKINVE